MKTKLKGSMKVAIACALSFALVFCSSIFVHKKFNNAYNIAYADQQNVNNYLEAKSYLANVKSECQSIMDQVSVVYNQIEGTTKLAFEAQRKATESRLYLNEVCKYEYTSSTQFNILATLACSESLEDFLKNMDYANSVMDFLFSISDEQAKRKAEFEGILNELNQQNVSQNKLLAEASLKVAQANSVLQSLKSKLTPAELAELEAEAAVIPGAGGGSVVPAGGGGGGDEPSPSPSPIPGPTPTPEPTPTPTPEPTPTPQPTWSSGQASAYGGSSDPTTPNPGITATGEICDDWSTGVAVPMAWENYRSYFHHTIQIQWNGITVLAKINDCGYMAGGLRSLDLQPGVFKAFGFTTCQAWGVREVNYLIM